MGMGRPKKELKLSEAEQAQLSSIARSRSVPAALSQRARIVLACAAGAANNVVARRFEITDATVGKWRGRFLRDRIRGLYDELRPGRPRSIDDERVAGLIKKMLERKPKDGAGGPGRASDRGQLQHAQACEGQSLAGKATALAHSLHPQPTALG